MTNPPPNPYVVGNPLTDPDGYGFYGRQDIYDFLREKLNAVHRPAILLHGHRRIGKTSILRQMPRFMPPEMKIVFFDTQGQAHDPLNEILYGIAYEIDEVLDLGGVDQDDITPEKFRSQFLPRVFDKLGGKKNQLILLFDEFDVLDTRLASDLLKYLRDLMTHEQEVGYIFVVGQRPEHLPEIFRDMSTIVYNIGRLTRSDTEKLIREPAQGVLEFPDEAVDRIWSLTSGHPLATQLVCFELWPKWVGQGRVPPEAVDAIVPDALRSGHNQLNWIYDGLQKATHRLFLSALADTTGADGRAELATILDVLRAHHVNISPNLGEVRSDLVNWDVIHDEGQVISFTVDLVRRWVANNRPLERMMREAPLVSKRAYRFYQTAEDLRMGMPGETPEEHDVNLQDAISNYRRALQINPLLVAARVGLANALLEIGDIEEALAESEKAYEVDPGQRDSLREVLLRLGERHEAQGDSTQALSVYNRALDLGEDPQARRRHNRILIARGEALVREGRFLEAIEFFEQAEASERAAAAKTEWQKAWRSLRGKLPRREKSGDWESAFELVAEYQERFPTDERADELAKEMQAKAKAWWIDQGNRLLAEGEPAAALELFTRARDKQKAALAVKSLEAEGKWEEALQALGTYAQLVFFDEEIADWRERLQQKLGNRLLETARKMESQQNWDRALEALWRYSQLFPSSKFEAWKDRLLESRRPVLVDKARAASKKGQYDSAIALLDKANRLELTRPVIAMGKRREWAASAMRRILWWLGFSIGAFVSIFLMLSFSPTGIVFRLAFLFTSLLATGALYLTLWILISDGLLNPSLFLAWRRTRTVSISDANQLPTSLNNAIFRRTVYGNALAWGVIFVAWEWLLRLGIGQQPGWFALGSSGLLGFLCGITLGMPDTAQTMLQLEEGSVYISGFFMVVAIGLTYWLPLFTWQWWGNFDIAHYIAWGLSTAFFGVFALVALGSF